MSSMDTIRGEKASIQRREHAAHIALSLLMLTAFLVSTSLVVALATSQVVRTIATLNGCLLVFFWCLLFFLIVVPGISLLGPYMQKTQRLKQNWLNEYGLHILAPITRHPGKNVLIVNGDVRGRNASYTVYLNWQDPQTEQLYAFPMNTRFSHALRNLPEGASYPVQFDPNDLSFFVVAMSTPRKPEPTEHTRGTQDLSKG
jgi:hypothetical protein